MKLLIRPVRTTINKLVIATWLLTACFICITGSAQVKYSALNGHSHNDYLNDKPFFTAYNECLGSIEADVFPVNGVLYVAHKKEEIQQQNTLKALYLDPLLKKLSNDSCRQLNLLIDVKENYRTALSLLVKELQPLIKYLTTLSKPGNITISISGNRPPPNEYEQYLDFIFFDDDSKQEHTPEQWQRVSLVSLPFSKFSKWTGEGSIPEKDMNALKFTIDSVHTAGKPIRFWAAPDNKKSWKLQVKLGVDLIGTDRINNLRKYLRRGPESK